MRKFIRYNCISLKLNSIKFLYKLLNCFTFNIVRLCFNIVDHPIHLNFKANSMPIIIKAKSSIDPCTHTGI